VDSSQLNIFDSPALVGHASALAVDPSVDVASGDRFSPGKSYAPGVRIRIAQAGPPIEHLNGRLGKVVSIKQGLASVQVEGVAATMLLSVEAIEKYSDITQYLDEIIPVISVGSSVESDYAFVGKVGVVRRVEWHCGALVAWVDYGSGKPWYPAAVENLSLA
jgi:hypothetical protein